MAYSKKNFDIAITFATQVNDSNLLNQLQKIEKEVNKAQKAIKLDVTDENAISSLNKYSKQFDLLFSTISESSKKIENLQKRFNALGQSLPDIGKSLNIDKYLDRAEKKIEKLEASINVVKERANALNVDLPEIQAGQDINQYIKDANKMLNLQEKINDAIDIYRKKYKDIGETMPLYDTSKTLKENKKLWDSNIASIERYIKSQNLVQTAVGDKVTISDADRGLSIADNVTKWTNEIRSAIGGLATVNINANQWRVYEVEVTRALTGLGVQIKTFTDNGVTEIRKLSDAGRDLAQTYINLSRTTSDGIASFFRGIDIQDEASVLQAFSDAIGSAQLTAYTEPQNLLGRETLKINIFDGVRDQVNEANEIIKQFNDELVRQGSTTIEEAQNIAEQFGMKFNLGQVVVDEQGRIHQSFELIKGDIKAMGNISSYIDEETGVRGLSIGSSTTIAKDNSLYSEYNKLKSENLKLTQEIEAAERAGQTNRQSYLQAELDANKQKIQDIRDQVQAYQGLGEVQNRVLRELDRIDAEVAQSEQRYQADKQDIANSEAIDKLLVSYNKLNQAKLEVYRTTQSSTSTDEQKARAQEYLTEAQQEYLSVLKQTNPELLNNKKYIDGVANSDQKLQEEQNKVNKSIREAQSNFKTLGQRILDTAKNVLTYRIAWQALQKIGQGITESVKLVHELDTAMTNMRMVTGQTKDEAIDTIDTYSELAKTLGVTTRSVAEGSVEWLRQGNSIEETAKLLESSTKLSTLGMLDSAEATELMTATLNGFNMTADQSEDIVDKLVKVDMDYATSAGEIATALNCRAV